MLNGTITGLGSNLKDHWRLSCSPQKSQHALGLAAWEGKDQQMIIFTSVAK